MIEGDYLRRTVPNQPRRDGAGLPRSWPMPAPGDGAVGDVRVAQAARRLACLQRLHPVLIDDRPVAGLRFDMGSDSATHRPALVAMIDVRGLANGRHELRVALAHDADDDTAEPRDSRIPFWR